MMKRGTKAQAAAGAAVLLAIIAGLLVMFIFLIPPSERAELLGEQTSGTSISTTIQGVVEKNLLTLSPGRIDYLAQNEIEHPLPVINVFTETEAEVIAEKNLVQATKTVFSQHPNDFTFQINDLTNTDNIYLSFNVVSASGRAIITLNDETILDAEVPLGAINPLHLPKNLLKKDNTLSFIVSSPGLAFWRTNDVSLESIKVVGDVTNLQAQTTKQIFLVSDTEKNNLEKMVLKFQPECKTGEIGPLTIRVNGEEIYNAVPECELNFVPLEFSSGMVQNGENEIVFRTSQGTYLLSHVSLTSKLKEVDYPTYYFELTQDEYNRVSSGKSRLRIIMSFVDVSTSKFGDIIFNGQIKHFDTREASLSLDFTADAVKGTNSIKIKPRKTIELRQLAADLIQ